MVGALSVILVRRTKINISTVQNFRDSCIDTTEALAFSTAYFGQSLLLDRFVVQCSLHVSESLF